MSRWRSSVDCRRAARARQSTCRRWKWNRRLLKRRERARVRPSRVTPSRRVGRRVLFERAAGEGNGILPSDGKGAFAIGVVDEEQHINLGQQARGDLLGPRSPGPDRTVGSLNQRVARDKNVLPRLRIELG